MIDENEQIKEVFAQYGLAVYLLQTLEKSIVTIVSFIQNINVNGARHNYDKLLASNFQLTLGKLIKILKVNLDLSETVKNQLGEVLRIRNWIIHHYWWDRAVEFNKIEERNRMIQELKKYQALFESLDNYLEERAKELFAKNGITAENLKTIYNEYLNKEVSPSRNSKRTK